MCQWRTTRRDIVLLVSVVWYPRKRNRETKKRKRKRKKKKKKKKKEVIAVV